MSKTIITYGTFDLFHIGHLKLLKRLANMADNVIIGVSTDEFNLKKNKKSLIPFEQRSEIVSSIYCVDLVIAEYSWEQKIQDIKKYNVDIFAIGNDWQGEFDFLSAYCEVNYLQRTKDISSSLLKKSIISPAHSPIKKETRETEKLYTNEAQYISL